jgi:chemotaxis protein methyltransferase CheR
VFNLMDSFSSLGTFDAIFCRNVAIYFSQDFKIALFGKMKRALHPGGMFVLGSSETLAYYSTEFQAKSHKNHSYYSA